ncbi:MAG: asparagine synthase C-terminal domain-containing protein [Novosphingobium sp.]
MAGNLGRTLVRDGCRILLNGEGGDEWLTGKWFYYAEQLRAGDWRSFFRSWRDDSAVYGRLRASRLALRYGAAYCLPQWFRSWVGKRRISAATDDAHWLSPELQSLLTQRRAAGTGIQFRGIANLARRAMYMELQQSFGRIVRDHLSRQSAQLGFDLRYPMFSRQFIEFAFATPERLRLRGGVTKFIHRKSLADLLPDSVANRTSKGEFSLAFAKHLGNTTVLTNELLTATVLNNWPSRVLSPQGVGQLYQRYLDAPAGEKPIWELWGAFMCANVFLPTDAALGRELTNGEL